MAVLRVITETFVPGCPKTKGSLDFHGSGRVTENVIGSKEWRRQVAYLVRSERSGRGLVEPSPASVAVGVRVLFVLPVPVGVYRVDPATGELADYISEYAPIEVRSGDLDKLCRNVLDALTDAGAYEDDVQVCRLIADKVYADGRTAGSSHSGALVQAWEMEPRDTLTARRTLRIGGVTRA